MKLNDLFPLLPSVDNGWTFAAFIILVALTMYYDKRDMR